MRDKLKEHYNQRSRFRGTLDRFGTKPGFKHTETTVLLLTIRDAEGNLLTDHLWFNYTKEFSRLYCQDKLVKGAIIEFNARVTAYEKGYRGDGNEFGEIDYKLSFPRKLEVVGLDESVPDAGSPAQKPYEIERLERENARWCQTCKFHRGPEGAAVAVGTCDCPEIITWMGQRSFPDHTPLQNTACIVLDAYPERCRFKEWKEPEIKGPPSIQTNTRREPDQHLMTDYIKPRGGRPDEK